MSPRHDARRKAAALLRHMRSSVETRPAVRGRSIASLAKEAGISYSTMWRALNRGQVSTREAHGTPVPDSRPVWVRTYDELRTRIDAGTYVQGKLLPAVTALALDMHVHFRTLKKALAALVEDGYLVARGPRYEVPQAAVTTKTAAVLCIVRGSGPTEIMPANLRFNMLLRDLELACTHRGIHLHLHTVYYHGSTIHGIDTLHRAYSALERKTLLGTTVFTLGLPQPDTVVHQAASRGAPLVVLDEHNLAECRRRHGHSPKLHWFALGNSERDGEAVGRYLLSMGHRHIGYVAHKSQLTAPRACGLRKAVEKRGGTLTALGLHDIDQATAARQAANRNERLAVRAIESAGIVPPQHSYDIRLLYRWRGQAERNMLRRASIVSSVIPTLEGADISAVVGYNDEIMVILKEALANYPPLATRLSLIGFDDSQDAANHRLTSYNFNTAAYVARMLDVLIDGGRERGRSGGGARAPVVLPGFVTERGSVRMVQPIGR